MNFNKAKRYNLRWRRYQRRSDFLTYGPENYFFGKEYDGGWLASWQVYRRALLPKLGSLKDVTHARGWRGR